jgi:hypothetical protein
VPYGKGFYQASLRFFNAIGYAELGILSRKPHIIRQALWHKAAWAQDYHLAENGGLSTENHAPVCESKTVSAEF